MWSDDRSARQDYGCIIIAHSIVPSASVSPWKPYQSLTNLSTASSSDGGSVSASAPILAAVAGGTGPLSCSYVCFGIVVIVAIAAERAQRLPP